ncbi:MAG: hypothetical protein J0H42_09900 [Rhizobiales bacterium]|nr:hypothetical protein [Hyphomicrobiales bacterium]
MEASTVLVRETRDSAKSVQIFGSVAASRSRLHAAMRNPRQSRCTAAISTACAENTPKRLSGSRNPRQRFSAAAPPYRRHRRRDARDGMGFEQILPDA